MADGQGLADLLSGAAGAPVNRPQLNAFVANSQAINGLRSAQTQDALLKAQQAQEELDAHGRIADELQATYPDMRPSEANLTRDMLIGHFGDAVTALKAVGQLKLGFGTPEQQTRGQQMFEGKNAPPVNVPPNFIMPKGSGLEGLPIQQTATGQALTGLDVAKAEEAHEKARNAGVTSTLSPAALEEAARVTMADPSKMSSYAGFGASGQKNRDAINNRRAQMLNDAGMTTDDMIRQRAITKASVGAAGQAAKQQQTLEAFMPLIKANGDRITELLDHLDASGGAGIDEPIVNSMERMLGRKLNSDDLTELHSVFTGYQAEVGRLLAAGPSMNGVISDHARELVNGMAPENMSSSGARRVINRIDTEIGIRHKGVVNSVNEAAAAQLPVISQHTPGNVPSTAPPSGGDDLPPGFTRKN